MTNIKKIIPIILLFVVVGLAIVSTTLGIEGATSITNNPDDFNVYFSKALVNGIEDQDIIVDKKTLYFENTINDLGEIYTIEYDITNASKQYDAEISVTCTGGNNYISVTNTIDTSNISARETRTGTLVIKKTAVNEGETITHETTCTITANAVEKSTLTETDVPTNLETKFTIGNEITLGTEKFNIIETGYSTVSLLAKNNLGTDYKQSETPNLVTFSDENGWKYTPGPQNIMIDNYNGNTKTYLANYKEYINSIISDEITEINVITLDDLKRLGCSVPFDATYSSGYNCDNSKYKSIIVNKQYYWTRTPESTSSDDIWYISISGGLSDVRYNYAIAGIRPIIKISKEILDNYL